MDLQAILPSMHLYIHVPFCARRCSYCDFAIAVRKTVPSAEFARSVLAEWRLRRREPGWHTVTQVETLYLGGGTPSRLEADELRRLIAAITGDLPLAGDAEVTFECNPDDVTADRARAWRRAGVNRISLGVQSFDDRVLHWMHRTHSAAQAAVAVETLRRAGLANISIDLIFALPVMLRRDWTADLQRAFDLDPTHLSLYGLTFEPHTPLARWNRRGEAPEPPDAAYADEYLEVCEALLLRGFDHYEVSNAAVPGFRARHNAAYWARRPFLGLGPSAHSFDGERRLWNIREWAAYQACVSAGSDPRCGSEELSAEALRLERLYLGLRTSMGVPVSDIGLARASLWGREGWAHLDGGQLRLTPAGWLRLDSLVLTV